MGMSDYVLQKEIEAEEFIRAEERERCAKLAENYPKQFRSKYNDSVMDEIDRFCMYLAEAIRNQP